MSRTARNIGLLALGSFFYFFTKGNYAFALAAWLYPAFWLPVSRREAGVYSLVAIPLINGIVSQFSLWKFTHDSPLDVLFFIPLLVGIPLGLLFALDRIMYARLGGFIATLIFPLLYTTVDFLLNLMNPFGTLGVLGYSQFDFPAMAQLASLTGMWGLTFMVTWFGSVVDWILDSRKEGTKASGGALAYLGVFLAVLSYGWLRLAGPVNGERVKVAGIHVHDRDREGNELWDLLHERNGVEFRALSSKIMRRLLSETVQQAEAGAKIVVWSELSPTILLIDEPTVIETLKRTAQQLQIYLIATPYTAALNGVSPENKTLVFSPSGEMVLEHLKFGGNFMEDTVEGSKKLAAVSTDHGKLSTIICWDGDFPSVVRQVGELETDILFVPASDWKEITPAHAILTAFRGIENGCSVVRQSQNGLSMATDPNGRVLAQMNHFTSDSWVMTAEVPTKGKPAIYPQIGDAFGWLAMIGMATLGGLAAFRPNRQRWSCRRSI